MTVEFCRLGIQCVKRKDVEASLRVRQEKRVDPFRTGFDYIKQAGIIDLNSVRLAFQVFLEGDTKGKYTIPLEPVVSEPIYDKKAASDLVIVKLSDCVSYVDDYNKEIILLCEKVMNEDIQIVFSEERDDGSIVWEALASFEPAKVHKHVAICFKPPRYRDLNIVDPTRVNLRLRRPSDGATSEPLPFEYLPVMKKRKRFKMDDFVDQNGPEVYAAADIVERRNNYMQYHQWRPQTSRPASGNVHNNYPEMIRNYPHQKDGAAAPARPQTSRPATGNVHNNTSAFPAEINRNMMFENMPLPPRQMGGTAAPARPFLPTQYYNIPYGFGGCDDLVGANCAAPPLLTPLGQQTDEGGILESKHGIINFLPSPILPTLIQQTDECGGGDIVESKDYIRNVLNLDTEKELKQINLMSDMQFHQWRPQTSRPAPRNLHNNTSAFPAEINRNMKFKNTPLPPHQMGGAAAPVRPVVPTQNYNIPYVFGGCDIAGTNCAAPPMLPPLSQKTDEGGGGISESKNGIRTLLDIDSKELKQISLVSGELNTYDVSDVNTLSDTLNMILSF